MYFFGLRMNSLCFVNPLRKNSRFKNQLQGKYNTFYQRVYASFRTICSSGASFSKMTHSFQNIFLSNEFPNLFVCTTPAVNVLSSEIGRKTDLKYSYWKLFVMNRITFVTLRIGQIFKCVMNRIV